MFSYSNVDNFQNKLELQIWNPRVTGYTVTNTIIVVVVITIVFIIIKHDKQKQIYVIVRLSLKHYNAEYQIIVHLNF